MIFSKLPGLFKNNKNVLYALFYNQDFNLLLIPLHRLGPFIFLFPIR